LRGNNPFQRVVPLKKILFDQILKTWGITERIKNLLTLNLSYVIIKKQIPHREGKDAKNIFYVIFSLLAPPDYTFNFYFLFTKVGA